MKNYVEILLNKSNRITIFAVVNLSAIISALLLHQIQQPQWYGFVFVSIIIITTPLLVEVLGYKKRPKETTDFSPPKNAVSLLENILPREDREGIIGDLYEIFNSEILPKKGLEKARCWFWTQTLSVIIHLAILNKLWGFVHRIFDLMMKIVR